ncbi:MAG: glycoside hydrolase family 92 protein, partial [Lewinella sp.]|nr:glycoside hydrolase family 92 protein [Lewinella sp.]
DAFWNSFWNLNGMLSLITPHITKNWVHTQMELFDKTGWTSKGPTGLEYSGVMEGSHQMIQMLSAYQKGIYTEAPDKLYRAMKKNVTVVGGDHECGGHPGNPQLDIYIEYGYLPMDLGFTNKTLDYAFDDWCVAQMAHAIGNDEDYQYFYERSKNYRNAFHPDLKYVVPKDSKGQWKKDYDPLDNYSFVEANGWEYSFYVPHDIKGVVEIMGRDLFNQRLEEGFERSEEHQYAAYALESTGGRKSQYYVNHGNQVNMQAAWLFNYSGKPWLTQKYTRDILEAYYGNTPYHGWKGDEDEGQMGAWFVMASMGLFEMNGGGDPEPVLDISSPLFERITIKLDADFYPGKEFVIEAKHNSKKNIYIQSARLNGKPLPGVQMKFKDVVMGGTLELVMGDKPGNK